MKPQDFLHSTDIWEVSRWDFVQTLNFLKEGKLSEGHPPHLKFSAKILD